MSDWYRCVAGGQILLPIAGVNEGIQSNSNKLTNYSNTIIAFVSNKFLKKKQKITE